MQNRYVGDVGDYGKYGLLRALCQPVDRRPALRLGVIWYLVPDQTRNNDGRHISYLEPTPQNYKRFRTCDPQLYDTLQGLVRSGKRSVVEVEASGILGKDTVFYSRPLSYDGIKSPQQRLAFRQQWMDEALTAMKGSDLVFVDPDNGLECSVRKQSRNGVKYAYYDEITRLVEAGKSVLIYHHLSRQDSAATQINRRLVELSLVKGMPTHTISLWFHRGSARAFFALLDCRLANHLSNRVAKLLQGGSTWRQHFTEH